MALCVCVCLLGWFIALTRGFLQIISLRSRPPLSHPSFLQLPHRTASIVIHPQHRIVRPSSRHRHRFQTNKLLLLSNHHRLSSFSLKCRPIHIQLIICYDNRHHHQHLLLPYHQRHLVLIDDVFITVNVVSITMNIHIEKVIRINAYFEIAIVSNVKWSISVVN